MCRAALKEPDLHIPGEWAAVEDPPCFPQWQPLREGIYLFSGVCKSSRKLIHLPCFDHITAGQQRQRPGRKKVP